MLERALFNIAFSEEWGRQMRFITGPRQAGKTTLSKLKLERTHSPGLYYLWDLRTVRNRYKTNELFFTEDSPPKQLKQWVCFDEIHKIPKWKNILKGLFDSTSDHYFFIVTGSAKLELFKRAGDSLSGRYFTFHLFPLILSEITGSAAGKTPLAAPQTAGEFIQKKLDAGTYHAEALSQLLEFSGFPEPFLKQSQAFSAKWSEDYMDTVIKEDIGALTRILDREHLYDLYRLLPEMTGSPVSESSLASHLELSHPTTKNYLKKLEDFYLTFKVHPYSKNIKRSVLKASKCYLYDWSAVQDPGKRFENYVAAELLTQTHLWKDRSGENFSLFYIRTKEKEEMDFLILKNKAPWLLIEAKISDGPLAGHHYKIQEMLGGIPMVQLCRQEGVCKMEKKNTYRISASRFLA